MPSLPNPKYTRNEAGEYLCHCVCGASFFAKAPHAIHCSRECRLKAKRDAACAKVPLKRKGKKLNNCLWHGCENKVNPPLHFCRKHRDRRDKLNSYADMYGCVI